MKTTAQAYKNAVELWIHLIEQYTRLRGSDPDENRKAIPRTTVADVRQLASLWDRELKKASDNGISAQSERRRWRECQEQISTLSRGLASTDTYPANAAFWRCTGRLAIYLESEKIAPSRWQIFHEAVAETLDELPHNVQRAAETWSRHVDKVLWIGGGLAAIWIITRTQD